MPHIIYQHEMVTLGTDLVVIGGDCKNCPDKSSLYIMTCQNQLCAWQEMNQRLKIGREQFVAMIIPDELVDCGKY